MGIKDFLDRGEKHPVVVIIAIALTVVSSWLFNKFDDDVVWIPVCAGFIISWFFYPSSLYVARLKILLPWAMVTSFFLYVSRVYEGIGIGFFVLGPIIGLILSIHTIFVYLLYRGLNTKS